MHGLLVPQAPDSMVSPRHHPSFFRQSGLHLLLHGQTRRYRDVSHGGVISSDYTTARAKTLIGAAVSGGSCNLIITMGSNPPANTPPPKPWEQAGSSSNPLPFKPPSSSNGGEAGDAILQSQLSEVAKCCQAISKLRMLTTN